MPSIAELRQRPTAQQPHLGSGWPAIDALTGGMPVGRSTVVRPAAGSASAGLASMAAWAAADGDPTIIASRAVTTEELWLADGAGGLGLPPRTLVDGRDDYSERV